MAKNLMQLVFYVLIWVEGSPPIQKFVETVTSNRPKVPTLAYIVAIQVSKAFYESSNLYEVSQYPGTHFLLTISDILCWSTTVTLSSWLQPTIHRQQQIRFKKGCANHTYIFGATPVYRDRPSYCFSKLWRVKTRRDRGQRFTSYTAADCKSQSLIRQSKFRSAST